MMTYYKHNEGACKWLNSEKKNFATIYFELLLSRQKLGTFLENKLLQKSKFSKNVNNEKFAPKIIFFNEKKLERFG